MTYMKYRQGKRLELQFYSRIRRVFGVRYGTKKQLPCCWAHMIRKGQLKIAGNNDTRSQIKFIEGLFGIAA